MKKRNAYAGNKFSSPESWGWIAAIRRTNTLKRQAVAIGEACCVPLAAMIVACLFGASVSGQWVRIPSAREPSLADGRPDLTGAAPRMADGRPDLSGLWNGLPGDVMAVIQVPFQPWAAATSATRMEDFGKDNPVSRCLPPGPGRNLNGVPVKIVQTPSLIVMLYDAPAGDFRQIFLDGRRVADDPDPTWHGYSVGRWDGDALVVETTGFNDRVWLNVGVHPHTSSLHTTERYQRVDVGHLRLEMTVDDPGAYTKPWTLTSMKQIQLDGDVLEYVCENEKDYAHLVGR
jgi:hypothetical protein